MATGAYFQTRRREAMTCGLCNQIFTTPKFLPCAHSCCLKCLENVVTRGGGTITSFPCPDCNKDAPVPEGGVSKFQDNFYLRAHELQRERDRRPCPAHPEFVVEFYCAGCDEVLCTTCATTEHKTHKKTDYQAALEKSRRMLQESDRAAFLIRKYEQEKRAIAMRAVVEAAILKKHAELVAMADKYRDDMMAALNAVTLSIARSDLPPKKDNDGQAEGGDKQNDVE